MLIQCFERRLGEALPDLGLPEDQKETVALCLRAPHCVDRLNMTYRAEECLDDGLGMQSNADCGFCKCVLDLTGDILLRSSKLSYHPRMRMLHQGTCSGYGAVWVPL